MLARTSRLRAKAAAMQPEVSTNSCHEVSMTSGKTGLVVTAHPGDFVWRAGGAIALHARKGYRIQIVCLSFGERGESQWAWKNGDVSLDEVKGQRRRGAARGRDPGR